MKTIELVCVNWGKIGDALSAVNHCIKLFPRFEKATIFHPDVQMSADGVHSLIYRKELWKLQRDIRQVVSQSKSQHMCFLKEVPQYITCDYGLSIQWDGFIIRPDLWDERFLEYDYIAPPWPLQNIINPEHRVGSGGFCLFSKRIAKYWEKYGDPEIPNDWERGAVNRKKYEDAGFTFAPIEVAARFGKEHNLEDLDINEGETFGFHDFRINTEHREKYKNEVYGER